MKLIPILLSLVSLLFTSGCVSNFSRADNSGMAYLSDGPIPIEFSTSGWSYTNTTNPFLLTPDYLTNAMVGVSRLKPGESIPNGPVISGDLSVSSLMTLLKEKASKYDNASILQKSTNGKAVAISKYKNDSRHVIEYAFELNGVLIHILLSAKDMNYFQKGQVVAYNIINTIKVRN